MGKLVQKGKNLRSWKVASVYKNKGGIGVNYCKPSELFNIKWSTCIVSHNATAHHHDASAFRISAESAQKVFPITWPLPCAFYVNDLFDVAGNRFYGAVFCEAPDKLELFNAFRLSVFLKPLLLGQHIIDEI